MISLFTRRYGAGPLHLIAHAAAFAIAAYALAQIIGGGAAINFVAWFGGAAILHDLVFLPLYSALDALARGPGRGSGRGAGRGADRDRAVPVINHIRAPALISGLLLLVYFPLILGPAGDEYFKATGHHLEGYARNWLLITATLFAVSALVYALRLRRRDRASTTA
jgi:hypothetical protein